jgi:hypothetical protein
VVPAVEAVRPAPLAAGRGGLPARPARRGEDLPTSREDPTLRAAVRAEPPGSDGARLVGTAANVYGSESARALFRRGLVEQVSPEDGLTVPADRGPSGPPANGSAPTAAAPGPGRPRRTRPLRAT